MNGATDGIADLGREAMAEMHRTLKLLRAGDDARRARAAAGARPTSTTYSSARARPACDVELAVEGDPRPLSQSVDLSAFRIVQEALTNVVKHAGRAHTTCGRLRPRRARADVSDTGDGAAAPVAARGRPRPRRDARARRAVRRQPTAGPRGDHGFEVHAVLPYGGGRRHEPLRVVIADDQPMMRAGFKAVLEATGEDRGRRRGRHARVPKPRQAMIALRQWLWT